MDLIEEKGSLSEIPVNVADAPLTIILNSSWNKIARAKKLSASEARANTLIMDLRGQV